MNCPGAARHVPVPRRLVWHHITPTSWSGTDTPDNLIRICDNCHATVHKRLNEYRLHGGPPPTGRYAAFIEDLARRGWEGADYSRPLPRTTVSGSPDD